MKTINTCPACQRQAIVYLRGCTDDQATGYTCGLCVEKMRAECLAAKQARAAAESVADGMQRAGAEQAKRADENADHLKWLQRRHDHCWDVLHDLRGILGLECGDKLSNAVRRMVIDLQRARDEVCDLNRKLAVACSAPVFNATLAEMGALTRARDEACTLVARMHAAAVGETRGPIRGVVEDVADLRAERSRLVARLAAIRAAVNT